MKVALFSDTHLTPEFDPELFEKLMQVIASADQVIINGDFWEGYVCTFDEFVTSEWLQLFEALRQKNTIYVYGNHDLPQFSDDRVQLFSVEQTFQHHFTLGEVQYRIEHGHATYRGVMELITPWIPMALARNIYAWLEQERRKQTPVGKIKQQLEQHFDRSGDAALRQLLANLPAEAAKTFLIFGHTHIPRFQFEGGYVNPGRFTAQTPGHLVMTKSGVELKGVQA